MKLEFAVAGLQEVAANALVVLTPAYDTISDKSLKVIDEATGGTLSGLLDTEEFSGKKAEQVTLFRPAGFKVNRIIMVGIGDADDSSQDDVRKAMGRVSRVKSLTGVTSAAVAMLGKYDAAKYQAIIEGYMLGSFKLLDYRSGDDKTDANKLATLIFVANRKSDLTRIEKAVGLGEIMAEGQVVARELAATPANYLTPKKYAAAVQKLARKYGFKLRVLDEKQIAKEKMGGLLSVAAGSVEPPRFLILEIKNGPAKQQPIVLVGKGVTFDSGGISLKPGLNMHEMKQDMAGSAAVVGAIVNAARLGIKRNIIGLIPTTENMPSGTATKPGDIITMRSGKTVEIINTDAEGRLILADALDYASTFDPQAVVDICTLTGATLFILGYSGAPIVGNNRNLTGLIETASSNTAERVWTMPLWDDFRDAMKSSIADLVNSGGRPAGTLTAAAFLENFVGAWPWAHVDIAYVDLEPKGSAYTPKGASGFGVRLLTDLLANWKKV